MRVSFTQFWRAANDLKIYPGNRKAKRMGVRKDWPEYKHGREHGELIGSTSVTEFVERKVAVSK